MGCVRSVLIVVNDCKILACQNCISYVLSSDSFTKDRSMMSKKRAIAKAFWNSS